jgi:GT2 family glycosyltransferase
MSPRTLVSIVTYNDAAHLERCLERLRAQTDRDCAIAVWDNASRDATRDIIAAHRDFIRSVRFSETNTGFSVGHNRNIASGEARGAQYVLVLNPDVFLEPGYLQTLVRALDQDKTAGSATGKLWRWSDGGATPARTLDTTGMYFTPNQRHFDRGAGEIDRGQYEKLEYVFGASGAAALYRKTMLDEIQFGTEYLDESFFAYREDADLAWRAQWLGWRCLYVPEAAGFHVRRVLPERRKIIPGELNMHSFKNRFLLRIKNMDLGTYFRFLVPITIRDLGALAYVLAFERSSLRAFPLMARALPRAWRERESLRRRRRTAPREVRAWFSSDPVTRPCPKTEKENR